MLENLKTDLQQMKNVNDFSLSERKDYLAPECEIIEVQGSNFLLDASRDDYNPRAEHRGFEDDGEVVW